MMEDAARASLDEVSIAMKKLPPLNWVDGQVR
jgi:predicted transcriptional regulator